MLVPTWWIFLRFQKPNICQVKENSWNIESYLISTAGALLQPTRNREYLKKNCTYTEYAIFSYYFPQEYSLKTIYIDLHHISCYK